jgi:5-methyltetrahydropteroyltriglutamate--homocysteine methyltransferase
MHSVDRFLTTHTGSLPRPDDLIEMVIATQRGDEVDAAALEARITSAVAESTRRASILSMTAKCRSRATPLTSCSG